MRLFKYLLMARNHQMNQDTLIKILDYISEYVCHFKAYIVLDEQQVLNCCDQHHILSIWQDIDTDYNTCGYQGYFQHHIRVHHWFWQVEGKVGQAYWLSCPTKGSNDQCEKLDAGAWKKVSRDGRSAHWFTLRLYMGPTIVGQVCS